MTADERRARRRARRLNLISKIKAFWAKHGDEICKWLERLRKVAPDINKDGVISDEEVAQYVKQRVKEDVSFIPSTIPIADLGVKLIPAVVYFIIRAFLLICSKGNFDENAFEHDMEEMHGDEDDPDDSDKPTPAAAKSGKQP